MFIAGRTNRGRRKPIENEEDAAMHIQRMWRGKQARSFVEHRKTLQIAALRSQGTEGLAGAMFLSAGEDAAKKSPKPVSAWEDPLPAEEEPKGSQSMLSSPEPEMTPEEMVHEFRSKLYYILEDPTSSPIAQIVSILILSVIIFSIACFILETMPKLRTIPNIAQTWRDLELFCTIVFTIEYVVRMSVCNIGGVTIWQFIKSPSNIFDVLAIMPFYVQALMNLAGGGGGNGAAGLRVLRAVRLIRLFRIFKLGRYSAGMQLMAEAVRNSFQALWVLCFFLAIGVVLFSCALYYTERLSCPTSKGLTSDQLAQYELECRASNTGWDKTLGNLCCDEHDSPLDFPSIVEAFWWAIVTMTTVGFGEISPKTTQGKIVGIVTMLSGILLIALPVAIVGRKFQEVYDEFIEKTAGQKERKLNDMFKKWYTRIDLDELEPPVTPMTGMASRLRQLQNQEPKLSEVVGELSDLFDEAEKLNDRIHHMRVVEVHRHKEIHSRFHEVLTTLAKNSDSAEAE
eukprot:gnl/MRDRNA2_/MRDRNA2_95758_c0_seq1.p1 gnl/MRDRNA2_/MRDRNA2_95758_c0~~gnl/MRDRNA2_/MRDRNA2_95758_c0_seq1.p1  ORF type:complete len:512 (-),score=90.13 gnl/MRDRNA2_/MRDRNA2_95758_c0_seq1:28-1563(-)